MPVHAFGLEAKEIYNYFSNGTGIGVGSLVVAAIASVVVFPQLYYIVGLDKKTAVNRALVTCIYCKGSWWVWLIPGSPTPCGGAITYRIKSTPG